MAKTSSYPSVDDQTKFTPAERTKFLETAMCLATGKKTDAGSKLTANIPFDTIVPTTLSQLTDDITVDTYDATSDSPISGIGVAAALANVGSRVYAEFTNGAYNTYIRKFELTSTTEVLTGLNSANIATTSTWAVSDGFVVPEAGLYRVTLTLDARCSQPAATIIPFAYGLMSKADADANEGSGVVTTALFMLDNVNADAKTVHMHATLMIAANDIIAPFLADNPFPNPFEQTNEPVNINLSSISFEKLGPYVAAQNTGN